MDKRKNNGGHSTKGRAGRPSKLDEEKANTIFIQAIKEKLKAGTDEEAKKKFVKEYLLDSQRGQLFVAEHIFGKAPQEVKNTNLNIEAKELSDEEIKRINKALEDAY